MTPSMEALIIIPLALNNTVSFSKISTKISLDCFFFLSSSFDIGFWIAVDATVLDLRNLGFQLDFVTFF
jgi:hypothetical protein